MRLVHGALACRLVEDGQLARWELRVTDNVPQLPVVNDFALAAGVSRRPSASTSGSATCTTRWSASVDV